MPSVKLIQEVMPNLCPMVRSPGTHISQLIHEICVFLGDYKADNDEGPNQALMELGNSLEYALIARYAMDDPDRYIQPGEIEHENLIGTPDLLDVVDKADCEIKMTTMSTNNGYPGSTKFRKYEMQLKAYLHMLGWTLGRLHVLFMRGDYSFEATGRPQYRVWQYEFSKAELETNWKVLKNQAARRDRKSVK